MEKSILDMVGGKSISSHYDIKAESSSYYAGGLIGQIQKDSANTYSITDESNILITLLFSFISSYDIVLIV